MNILSCQISSLKVYFLYLLNVYLLVLTYFFFLCSVQICLVIVFLLNLRMRRGNGRVRDATSLEWWAFGRKKIERVFMELATPYLDCRGKQLERSSFDLCQEYLSIYFLFLKKRISMSVIFFSFSYLLAGGLMPWVWQSHFPS